MINEFEKLENALLRAGREMEYPATPAIAARVRAQLSSPPTPLLKNQSKLISRGFLGEGRFARAFVPIAAALLLALALLLAFPNTREAIGQFLGLRGLQIFYVTPTPTALPTSTPPATDVSVERISTATPYAAPTLTIQPFTLCCKTSLQEAQRRSRFKLLLPPGETPSRVYYLNIFDNGEQVVMVFGDPENPRMTLYQAQRWIYQKVIGHFGKFLEPTTILAETTVNGERAFWFSGTPHRLVVLDANGEPVSGSERTVSANTLVWETGDKDQGITYRLETQGSLSDAIRIAESLQ